MKKKLGVALIGSAVLATTALAVAPGVVAESMVDSRGTFTTVLTPLNNSGVSGTAWAKLRGNKIDAHFDAHGLVADAPHAVHIHYGEEAIHECPTFADDANMDGMLSTLEGVPKYGPVAVSLTTSGDTSPASALAIARFGTAPGGVLSYHRRAIQADTDLVKELRKGEGVLVIHGVDYNGNGMYDAAAGMSDLDPTLPREATDPAACGVLK